MTIQLLELLVVIWKAFAILSSTTHIIWCFASSYYVILDLTFFISITRITVMLIICTNFPRITLIYFKKLLSNNILD